MGKGEDAIAINAIKKKIEEQGPNPDDKFRYGLQLAYDEMADGNTELARKIVYEIVGMPTADVFNMANDIDLFIEQTYGRWFDKDEIIKELAIIPERRQNLSTILHRRWKKGVIEKHPTINKRFRKVMSEGLKMDWQSAEGRDIKKIKYPFGIHEFYKTFPKSIMILAGYPNSGKSAWLYDFIKMNQNTYPNKIHYFNSDSSRDELKERLAAHEDLDVRDWKFKCYERATNWADVIVPNQINLIDYMAIHEDFYLIGKWIEEIWNKLNNGIAIIALQKDAQKKTSLGRGGVGTIEKARFYMTMEYDRKKQCGIARIEKQKTKKDGINRQHYLLEYKIYNGWKIEWREWYPEWQ